MKTIFIFCSYFILFTYSVFSFAFNAQDIESYLDKMLSYQLDFKEQEKKLSGVIRDVSHQLVKDNENPYLWYLKGRSSFAAIYTFKKTDERYDEYKKLIPIEFEKALSLNKDRNTLTVDQLYKLYTKAYSFSVSEEAARQYLALKKQKTTLHKKEHLRLLRETIIPLLIKQNKFNEALKEMDYVDKHFPEKAQGSTGNIAWRQHYEKEIVLQKSKIAEAQEQEKTTQPTEPKKSDVKQPRLVVDADQKPATKSDEHRIDTTPKEEVDYTRYLLVLVLLAVGVVVLVYLLRRRGKKQTP